VDKIGNDVVFEIKGDEIEQVDVHGIVGEYGPFYFIKSTIDQPEFGNGQMMDKGITSEGRG
jgi:hypothetical protein